MITQIFIEIGIGILFFYLTVIYNQKRKDAQDSSIENIIDIVNKNVTNFNTNDLHLHEEIKTINSKYRILNSTMDNLRQNFLTEQNRDYKTQLLLLETKIRRLMDLITSIANQKRKRSALAKPRSRGALNCIFPKKVIKKKKRAQI